MINTDQTWLIPNCLATTYLREMGLKMYYTNYFILIKMHTHIANLLT